MTSVSFDLSRFGGAAALAQAPKGPDQGQNGWDAGFVPDCPRDTVIVLQKTETRNEEEGGEKGKTIRKVRDVRDSRGQAAPPTAAKFQFVEGVMQFGDVCAGWSPEGWAKELRRKAACCETLHPDTAHHYRRWATDIEARP